MKKILLILTALLSSCGWWSNDPQAGTSTTTTTNGIQAQISYQGIPTQAQIWIRPTGYLASDSTDAWTPINTTTSSQGELNWTYTYTGHYDSLILWIMDSTQSHGLKKTIPSTQSTNLGELELLPLSVVQGQLVDRNHQSPSSDIATLGLSGFPFVIPVDSLGYFEIPLAIGSYQWVNRISGIELQDLVIDNLVDTLQVGLLSYDSQSVTVFDTLMAKAVAYWNFDDTLDGLVSDDLRNLNPGDIWRELDLVEGVKEGAYAFTDTRFEHLTFSTSVFHFAAGKNFSIALWIQVDSTAVDSLPIFWKEAAGLSRYLLQVLPNGTLEFSLRQYINIDKAVTSPMVVRDGQWHHVACLRRGDVMELWIDGALQRSFQDNQIQISPLDDGVLNVGADRTNTWRFKGLMDEMVLFLFDLDSAQIAHLYEAHAQ